MTYHIKIGNWTSKRPLSAEEAVKTRRNLSQSIRDVEVVVGEGKE